VYGFDDDANDGSSFAPLFDSTLRRAVVAAGRRLGERVVDGGVYVATEGPRLESAAEIEAAARDGADVVGMTLSPEVWLARELALPFASLAIVTNRATGTAWRDGRRDFSPTVGERAMRVLLAAAGELSAVSNQPSANDE
jgi:purine nucleoside phosphorylase